MREQTKSACSALQLCQTIYGRLSFRDSHGATQQLAGRVLAYVADSGTGTDAVVLSTGVVLDGPQSITLENFCDVLNGLGIDAQWLLMGPWEN